MEQTDPTYIGSPSSNEENYWPSVLLIGGIFGLVGFLLNITFGYMQIASEPTGSILSPVFMGGIVVCLATCVGGLVSVWHFTRQVSPRMKLGRGALIGFLTGAVIVVISTLLNELWMMIDPEYTEKLLESIVENVEEMDLPADTRDQMIDRMASRVRDTSFAQQLLFGIPVTGLLNLLTGMLGVKLFAANEPETV